MGTEGSVAERIAVDEREIRVLVENGEYWLRNRGDIAMMVVTVDRIRARWPRARIGVLTHQPSVLRGLLPEAEPISGPDWSWGAEGWHGLLTRTAGTKVVGPAALWWRATTDGPKDRLRAIRTRARGDTDTTEQCVVAPELEFPVEIPAAVEQASLVLANGGGYMTDVDRYQAHRTLNLLEHACALGIPTALIGQGMGPMRDPYLLRRAAEVLPKVDFVALREGRRGPELLGTFGVTSDRVLVTGDDAVEFAYRSRDARIGADIGVCLRVADYAQVSAEAQAIVGEVVRTRAAELDAGLVPLIISEYASEDRLSTLPLLAGAIKPQPPVGRGGTAQEVARQVGQCRVLVTSAYHLAVFALAQGIPAVGITASEYYDDKFHGLAQMFGAGLRVVHLNDPKLEQELTMAVDELWDDAPALRDPLQQRAVEQIDAGRSGLERVFGLVESGPVRPVPRSGG
ncbi:polysaccharide pyruvyl transferase family protein [Nocardia sp. NBC_00565]|uniref:polysaccharide pyruvyl transferase family protein n=1 Tax=Nocardia sp. NBC_00565 TaxID=2975993 RepID=UPI002E803790|nr:polysaccharide pyruvyl transferase family protein [Nocardia sp. NBC_00565]WUC05235.1 polysaccharide pyruvyl transferase family protein [Nocardia sp. NBC_00565]